jgi:PAS domain S-box-containing protein
MASSAEIHTGSPRPAEPIDAVLERMIEGFFILTDGQGKLSKWCEAAELLFGLSSGDALGRGFFETLIDPSPSAEAIAWQRFLGEGEPPRAPGRVRLTARHAEGHRFPLEAVFVPVRLDEGFDFSLFLEDLGLQLPDNLMLLRIHRHHPIVVRALRAALESQPRPWEGWRIAGTIIAFEPLAPTPWIEEELRRREEERAVAAAATAERLTNPDPGIRGDSIRDLDDAAAVVARLLSALERIDELERRAGEIPRQLEEARREIRELKSGLTSAGESAAIARREAEEAKAAAAVVRELLPKRERAPRPGFDDASLPLAILDLDGRFRELNPSFSMLVGYEEDEFAEATWPSPLDESLIADQRRDLERLVRGEVDSVPVRSTYMHGQGLMVPVIGQLNVVQGDDGSPSYLLLRAEDRAATA